MAEPTDPSNLEPEPVKARPPREKPEDDREEKDDPPPPEPVKRKARQAAASDETFSIQFGSNLYPSGFAARVEKYFTDLIAGPGAVRRTLQQEV